MFAQLYSAHMRSFYWKPDIPSLAWRMVDRRCDVNDSESAIWLGGIQDGCLGW